MSYQLQSLVVFWLSALKWISRKHFPLWAAAASDPLCCFRWRLQIVYRCSPTKRSDQISLLQILEFIILSQRLDKFHEKIIRRSYDGEIYVYINWCVCVSASE